MANVVKVYRDSQVTTDRIRAEDAAQSAAESAQESQTSYAETLALLNAQSVLIPNGYTGNAGTLYNVYRTGDLFFTNINPSEMEFETDVTYYLSPIGNDSNSGLTPAAPKQSIRELIIALNAASATSATFILEDGEYGSVIGWGIDQSSPNFDLVIKCNDGRAVLSRADATFTSWSKTGGRTNVYEYTKASGSAPGVAYDETDIDEYGHFARLTPVADIATVDSTPGSMFVSGLTIYVHTFDSRAADASVRVLINNANANLRSGTRLFAQNIDFWGGDTTDGALWSDSNDAQELYFINCTFGYHFDGNGLGIDDLPETSIVQCFGCEAFYNFQDGFNYHAIDSGVGFDALEVNCRATYNGYQVAPNDNGSTAHEAVRIVRLNGDYRKNKNRNIHDIQNAQSWNLGCVCADPQVQTIQYESFNFGAGRLANTDDTRMWLDSCQSFGALADISSTGDAVIKYRKFTGEGLYQVEDTATLSAY